MKFHEKLYKLRKEKGMSQEALSQQLHTSRQAVSKWESGQGFPDTEKLLMLGNIFEVSMDYLLKDNDEQTENSMNGYYVSKEMAHAFIDSEKRLNGLISYGAGFMILSGIPYAVFQNQENLRIISMAILIAIGVAILIMGALKDVQKYKVFRREVLLFDAQFLKELTIEYNQHHRKLIAVAFFGAMLLVIGFIPIVMVVRDYIQMDVLGPWYALCFLLIAIGFICFVVAISSIETYQLLVKNSEYTNRLFVKLRWKIRNYLEYL